MAYNSSGISKLSLPTDSVMSRYTEIGYKSTQTSYPNGLSFQSHNEHKLYISY